MCIGVLPFDEINMRLADLCFNAKFYEI